MSKEERHLQTKIRMFEDILLRTTLYRKSQKMAEEYLVRSKIFWMESREV